MESPKLGYVNVYCTDLARTVEFFARTLGLELQYSDEKFGYASVDAGPVRMGLAQIDPSDETLRGLVGRQTGVGFSVADLDAAYVELRSRGVRFTIEPEKYPWGGYMAMFADPDDNTYYLDQLS